MLLPEPCHIFFSKLTIQLTNNPTHIKLKARSIEYKSYKKEKIKDKIISGVEIKSRY
jgi:hypothetical protein